MQSHFLTQVGKYQAKHRRRQRWYRIVSALACVVVFCTTYALILPAITMETSRVLDCPLEVHTHSPDCYDEDGGLICGSADFVVHTHDASCYDKDGTLVCPLPEISAHTHTDECSAKTRVLTCGLEEGPGHVHNVHCFAAQQGALICGIQDEDHQHTEACYEQIPILTCGLEEAEGHIHDESCYTEERSLICDIEDSGHEHTDQCYQTVVNLTCGLEKGEGGHTHTSDCYSPICEIDEGSGAHTHTTQCYTTETTLVCGQEEIILHQHTDQCYDADGSLICGQLEILEHTHSDECFRVVSEYAQSYTYEDDLIVAEAVLPAGSTVPSGAELVVRPITSAAPLSADGGSYDYETLVRQAEQAVDRAVAEIVLYDISFYTPDGEYLPVEDAATVSLRFKEAVLTEGTGEVAVLHYQEEAAAPVALETVDVERDESDALSALTFRTEGFSVFAVMALSGEPAAQADTSSFLLTYTYNNTPYTITFNITDSDGKPISGTYEGIEAKTATRYIFGEKDANTAATDNVEDKIAPEIAGYTYSGAKYDGNTVYSVATSGYGTVPNNQIRFYSTEPIDGQNYYTRDLADYTVTLTYTSETPPDYSGNWAIVNLKKGYASGAAMLASGLNGDENKNRAGQTVTVTESAGTKYVTDNTVTIWHFERQTDGTYYISTKVDGQTKYLTIGDKQNAAVTLSDTAQAITVTKGTGNYAGMVRLTNGYNMAVNLFGGSAAQGFGSYSDGLANEWQTLCRVLTGNTLAYNVNLPSLNNKGSSWQADPAPSLDSTLQEITAETTALYGQPSGFSEELGTAKIANLYRYNLVTNIKEQLSTHPAWNKGLKDNWYGEERFDGWTYTAEDGTIYLFAPEAAITQNPDGTISAAAYKTIVTNNNIETIETIEETQVPLPAGATLTGHWTEVSSPVMFFVNYKGTILDTEGDVSGRRTDTFTLSIAVGHVFYGKQTVGEDQVFGAGANAQITDAISPAFSQQFNPDNPHTQIVIDYLRKCTQKNTGNVSNPTEGTDYKTSMEISAPGANSTEIAANTLRLLKETGRTIQIATGASNSNSPNPTIDSSLCDGDHYEIRWYVLKEQNDSWHIDGVLVAKTAEIGVTKTFSGLSTTQAQDLLNKFNIDTKLGTGDSAQNYLSITTTSKSGQYEYIGSNATGNLPNSYHWTLHAITDETYTLKEQDYALDGYDVSSIVVHYYDNLQTGTSEITHAYSDSTSAEELGLPVTGGVTTAVSFNNFYTPTGTGAMAIVKRDSTTSANDAYGMLQGAKFTLYTDKDCTIVAKDRGNQNLEVTTNANGTAYFSGMEAGTYYLKETKAPEGYIASDKVFQVVVEKDANSGNIVVTLYEPSVADDGTVSWPETAGTTLYNGGIQGSYIVPNEAKTGTITVVKTFSGLDAVEMQQIYDGSKAASTGRPTGYYIQFQGNIGGGTVEADGSTSAILTLDQAARSGSTFTWTIHDLEVGTEGAPVMYTITEHNYTLASYVDVVVTAKMTNPQADDRSLMDVPEVKDDSPPNQAYLIVDRGAGTATINKAIFSANQSDVLTLTNHYTNTFNMKLRKVDAQTDEPLANAEFKIYGPYRESTSTGDSYTYTDADGTAHTVYYIQTITSGADGYAVLSNLSLSNGENTFVYILDESKAPSGYAAAPPQVVTVTVTDDAISSPTGSDYMAGVLEYSAPNTKEEDYVHEALDTRKVWEPYQPEGQTVTLELYRVIHTKRNVPLDETVPAELIASIELDGVIDAAAAAAGDGDETDMTVYVTESEPWVATWMNLYSASKEYSAEHPEHYHYFVREVTEVNGFVTSYTCYEANGIVPKGAIQKLELRDGSVVEGVLLADMDEDYTVTITNSGYYELPKTGGAGPLPYAIGGTLLMACGLLYGYLLRRKNERRSAR